MVGIGRRIRRRAQELQAQQLLDANFRWRNVDKMAANCCVFLHPETSEASVSIKLQVSSE
jgi:hypothetical protein